MTLTAQARNDVSTRLSANAPSGNGRLLHSPFSTLASNTIDYWMLPDDPSMTERRILKAIEQAPVLEDASLQIYLHVPFCAQHCRFCAFSGGNSLNFKAAERYSRLLVLQLQDLLGRTKIKSHKIRSVNIGGGSPDLLNGHIDHVLRAVKDLPGFSAETEVSVEFTLSTVKSEFIEALVQHGVTKASFGIQTLNTQLRGYMRQPKTLQQFDRVLEWIDGRIPVVNADLITGLPGHDLATVLSDLRRLMEDPRINCISSYVLTPAAAPALVAAVAAKKIPPQPPPQEQALMRLHTYAAFSRSGWIRRGTNSYVNPHQMSVDVLNRIAGNECIGASNYEAFLIGVGPQAVSSLPGARVENLVDIEAWCEAMERGEQPFHLPKCRTTHQTDMALWVFPLRWEGLPYGRFERMLSQNALSDAQLEAWKELEECGLVTSMSTGYELSIIGEVFMGHLVRGLRQDEGKKAVDDYVREGLALGQAISEGRIRDVNPTNNRQLVQALIDGEPAVDVS